MGKSFGKPTKISESSTNTNRLQKTVDIGEDVKSDIGSKRSSNAELFLQHITKKKQLLSLVDSFETIDLHARNAPPEVTTNIDNLLTYLMSTCSTSLNTVRTVYIWVLSHIGCKISPDTTVDVSKFSLLEVLSQRQGSALEINILFHYMCQLLSVPCVLIHGIIKSQNDDVHSFKDNPPSPNHVWSIVLVQNEWRFVDCASGGGNMDAECQEEDHSLEMYFLTDPDVFILTHFPLCMSNQKLHHTATERFACQRSLSLQVQETLQMLEMPISFSDFCKAAIPTTFALNNSVELISHSSYHVTVKMGDTFEFTAPHFVNMAAVLSDVPSGNVLKNSILATRSGHFGYRIFVKPRHIGKYCLKIYGAKKCGDFRSVMTYRLHAEQVDNEFVAMPELFGVWGASLNALQYGFTKAIFRFDILTCRSGEIYIKLPTTGFVQTKSILMFGSEDNITERAPQSNQSTLNQYTEGVVHIMAKLRQRGFYRLSLQAQKQESDGCENSAFSTVTELFIHSLKPSLGQAIYPRSYPVAQSYQTLLLEPLTGELEINKTTMFRVRSMLLTKAKVEGEVMVKTSGENCHEGDTWSLEYTPKRVGVPVYIYGTVGLDASMHALYKFSVVIDVDMTSTYM
ncbi:kyphoscoliosis peptidase [Biomphalaria glabrata]|nr:kyphoscoliosis peptidase [Biomphalaria glabrata]